MSGQIMFLEKSKCDFTNTNASATASQGSTYASYLLDRSNRTAWVTSGSVDSDLTTIDIDFTEARYIDFLALVKTNAKSYTWKYWNGSTYVDFATAIDVTNNTKSTVYHRVTEVLTQKLRVTIRGTMIADADKYVYQLIATSMIGQLAGWPVIKKPTHNLNRIVNRMLSGKVSVAESVGGFSMDLEVANWKSDADLTIVERLYSIGEGFLVWACGGDATQFSTERIGYRLEDFFLMRPTDNYMPEYVKGLYKTGLKIKIALAECVQ